MGSDVPAALTAHSEKIETALRDALGGGTEPLAVAARYALGWEDRDGRATAAGGKRIRPALCLAAAEAFGGSVAEAMPGAVAVELVHNFSLVHDEVQDHDDERHHRPTLWALIGEAQAINVGDFLYTRAVLALTRGGGTFERRLGALDILNEAIERMIAGQWQDIALEDREHVTVEDYLAMVSGKTGALLAAPLTMGAILAGAPAEAAHGIGRWGLEVGLAFQAQDDYLGTWGDPNSTGKSNTNDIARHKKTLPVVHGLNNPDAATVIRRAYDTSSGPTDVPAVVQALEAAGADVLCREQARAHAAAAALELERLPLDDGWKATFREIGGYLVERSA
ncbi:MAG: polyprenyl synthetase family protein [Tepidiformaceae bacterium]